jgi:Family of unknown function (DUF6220)
MSGLRRGAAIAYRYLTPVFFLAVIVQIFLAGAGIFGLDRGEDLEDQSSFDPHRALGFFLEVGALLLLILALVSWPRNKRVLGWYFLLAVMAIVIQPLLAGLGEDHRWIGAFHPVDGVAILALSGWLASRMWRGDVELSVSST